jgi:hypothetical protein
MKATRCFLYAALLWEMWDFLPWFCVYPCRRGINIQQYAVQTVSSAENVTCYIVKANEVWVKTVRQIDNLYANYFVLQVYACKPLISLISKKFLNMLRSSSTHFSLQFNSDVECEALS